MLLPDGSVKPSSSRSCEIPLAIMTSGDTHDRTVALLEERGYFGLQPSQVHLMRQDKVPTMTDANGRLARAMGTKYELLTKPHGHGDVHFLLHRTGLARRWVAEGKHVRLMSIVAS